MKLTSKGLVPAMLFSALLLAGCISHPSFSYELEASACPEEQYIPQSFDWQEIAPGISRYDFQGSEFPVIYHAVRIELTTPGLKIQAFPDQATLAQELKGKATDQPAAPSPFLFRGTTTLKFSRNQDCIVAMNASPFGGKKGSWNLSARLSPIRQIIGIHKVGGLQMASPNSRYAALCFRTDSTRITEAKIIKSQSEEEIKKFDYAFGGFFSVLENSTLLPFQVVSLNSRSGAGLSEDGKTLCLLAVEGEFPHKSKGLSYPQCAKIFRAMGCSDALEFDGGGSTQLVIKGKSVLTYSANRIQGNSFGFSLEQ